MQKLHERSDNNIKLDIARNSKQLSESSEPLQQELSEALKYRVNLIYHNQGINLRLD